MSENKKRARLAGSLYFILVIMGIVSLLVIPGRLYVWDDAAATLTNIEQNQTLFRIGIVSGMLAYLAFLFLPLALYSLLGPVHRTAALIMVALAVASVPLSFMNMGSLFEILRVIADPEIPTPGHGTKAAEVMALLKAYNDGNLIAQLFWGLWLLPLGYLIFRSGILPKLLGIILMLGSVGYTLDFFGRVLWPPYMEWPVSGYITLPASVGEIGTCLWLLIVGAKAYPET